jgi:hypothetical protein
MEAVLGLIAAGLGLMAALVSRKTIVVHRHEVAQAPVAAGTSAKPPPSAPASTPAQTPARRHVGPQLRLGRRLRRAGGVVVLAVLYVWLGASFAWPDEIRSWSLWPGLVCITYVVYQISVIVVIGLARPDE